MTGTPSFVRKPVEKIRLLWPSFLKLKMLMVGCSPATGLTLDFADFEEYLSQDSAESADAL
jgi:hypothetical protein